MLSILDLAREIHQHYRKCKLPIVDVQIPEQRITGGTMQLVVIESRIDRVRVQRGCYFDCEEVSRWIACTRAGDRVYEPNLENDLLWLNQNPFRRVSVDFQKGSAAGTTDVIYKVSDVRPVRGCMGIDDTGVQSLNYGRFFTGFSYGDLFGRGGILGYQYTTDEEFALLKAHSLSYTQPLSRCYSWQSYGSWAAVSPELPAGLVQDGESWQTGSGLVRHLIRTRDEAANVELGAEFKSTDNNLEFTGSTVAASNADLFQLHLGYDHFKRGRLPDEYARLDMDMFVGPGGGMTGVHSAAAFTSIRPGTSPDYIYGKAGLELSRVVHECWQMVSRLSGQVASERLLFSETLGIGGFDSLRGFDQRAFNADHGWIANFEFGPRTQYWGCEVDQRVLRNYAFMDLANGYLDEPLPGEDASTFAWSTGLGARFQISDRLIARFDYGIGLVDLDNVIRNDRGHFTLTWIPGPRPK